MGQMCWSVLSKTLVTSVMRFVSVDDAICLYSIGLPVINGLKRVKTVFLDRIISDARY